MTTSPDLGPDATTAALPGGPLSEGQKSRPVRVPNVSPSARSGIDGEVIGSNAQEAYDATADPADAPDGVLTATEEEADANAALNEVPVVPEDLTTVDAVLGWVYEDDSTAHARAQAALDAEYAKAGEDQRSTLVGPLEAFLAASPDEDAADPSA